MNGREAPGSLALVELVEPARWQRLQDHFTCVLGVAIRTISPSRQLLINPSWPTNLNAEQIVSALNIGEELERLVPFEHPPVETASLTTPLGITYAAVPIRVTQERPVAYFIIGPAIVGTREDELQFRSRVEALGQNAQALWPLILSLKLYTFAGIRATLTLMEEVGSAIAQLAYQAKQLSTIMPATSKVDQAVVAYHSGRILRELLEAAMLATKAEGGSVMMYDTHRDALEIIVAKGLNDTVVTDTRLKRGEGIAGLAVSERSIWLIDRQVKDERIKQRMGRQELVSSLVASLGADDHQEPVGVLNLRTSNPQKRFTQEHVELLRRLLDLAGAALASLRFPLTNPTD